MSISMLNMGMGVDMTRTWADMDIDMETDNTEFKILYLVDFTP
jgi:hypothetical protein